MTMTGKNRWRKIMHNERNSQFSRTQNYQTCLLCPFQQYTFPDCYLVSAD